MITLNMPYEKIEENLKKQGERFAPYRSKAPIGEKGPWKIEKFTVKLDLQNMRMIRDGRGCAPGEYTRLVHKKRGVVMSDTDAEINDFLPFVHRAYGRVLVAGLGMGLVVQNLLDNPNVKKIVVLEIDNDVFDLTTPMFDRTRAAIAHADVLKWETDCKFDFGWYDIWDSICGDNAAQMRFLKSRFKKFVRQQECWSEQETMELE